MARATGILGGVLLFIGMLAAAVPWAFSTQALRTEIMAQIRQTTGLAAMSQGRAVFVVLPQPHISIDDVSLTDPSGALRINARTFKGYLRVSAILRGQLEIAWVSLGQPDMAIDVDGRPMPADSAIGRAADAKPESAEAASADQARLGSVTLVDGRAHLTRETGSSETLIDGINVTIDWRRLGDAARMMGQARFHGETANIGAWIERPTELLRGGRSAMAVNIEGPAATVWTRGVLNAAPTAQYSGHAFVSMPSLRKLLESGGRFIPLPGPFGDFVLDSDATIDASGAAFSGMRLRLDGNEFEGALAVQNGAKNPIISGTLATELLSLQPFLANLSPAVGRDGQWSRDPFDLTDVNLIDLDLRISATRVAMPNIELEDAAFAVMGGNSRLEFDLAEAKAYRGKIRGRASISAENAGFAARANGSVSDVDIAALPSSAFGWGKFAGSLSGSANVESTGASMNELMRNLSGEAQITVARGELSGVDLDQALRGLDKRPLALPTDIRRGGTAFDQARFGLRIKKGVAEIEDGALRSAGVALAFGGVADVAERTLNLNAVARSADAKPKSGQDEPEFRFDVVGSWDDLTLIPDVGSLIRRSDWAAPLLPPKPEPVKPAQDAERQN